MTLQEILRSDRAEDIYILARYFYRIGQPIIPDYIYEKIDAAAKECRPEALIPYLERDYDDDPVPLDLLQEIGIEPVPIIQKEGRADLYNYFNEEKSNSIDSKTNYKDAYDFFMFYVRMKKDLMTSLKMDGDNTKSLYLNGNFRLGLSRGRSGNSFDWTDTLAFVMPTKVTNFPDEIKVYSEAYVEKDYLPVLREKYSGSGSSGYVTCKSAAISLLSRPHQPEDYKHLHAVTFFVDGSGCDTLDQMFDKASEAGFTVVEHKLLKWQDIPTDYHEFCTWLKKEVFDYFYEIQITNSIPADGIVVEVNDLAYNGNQVNQYNSRQLALKFEQWSFKLASGVVEEIIWQQKRVFASCRLRIKPTTTYDGSNAEYINGFNHSILVSENIKVGSTIYFERNSGAVNILVYGEDLQKKLGRIEE